MPSGQPVVTPVVASQATAPQNGLPTDTSSKGASVHAGASSPSWARRYRNAAMASRVTGEAGR